jgi:hypothetical protein
MEQTTGLEAVPTDDVKAYHQALDKIVSTTAPAQDIYNEVEQVIMQTDKEMQHRLWERFEHVKPTAESLTTELYAVCCELDNRATEVRLTINVNLFVDVEVYREANGTVTPPKIEHEDIVDMIAARRYKIETQWTDPLQ